MQNYHNNGNRFHNRSDNWGNRQGWSNQNGPRKSRSVKNLMDINNFDLPFGFYDLDVERERNSRNNIRWNERQERAGSLPPQNHRIYNNLGTNDQNLRSNYDRSKFRAQTNRKMSISPQRRKQNTSKFDEGSCSEAQSFLCSKAENSLRSKNNMLAKIEFKTKLEDSGDNEKSSIATEKLALEPVPDSMNDSIDKELGSHAIVSEIVTRCHACKIICLQDADAVRHIKTRSHKVNLKKLLQKVTNINVVTHEDLRRACKIATFADRFFSDELIEHATTSDDE